jgi:hypothetical protein
MYPQHNNKKIKQQKRNTSDGVATRITHLPARSKFHKAVPPLLRAMGCFLSSFTVFIMVCFFFFFQMIAIICYVDFMTLGHDLQFESHRC